MKTKLILIGLLLTLLSSCVVKSLKPFYTTESLKFQKEIIGKWEDKEKNPWEIIAIKDIQEKDFIPLTDKEHNLRNFGYYVTYGKQNNESNFIAMPFTIDGNIFMDFIPLMIELNEPNTLTEKHLIQTHSVAKIKILKNNSINITWLSEEKIRDLINNNKIRIKHEKIGPEENLVLTASSEELYKLIKKYNNSNIKDKWKTDEEITLKPINVKP